MLVLGQYNVNDGVRYVKLYDEVLSSGTWNFKEDVEPPRTVQFFPTSQVLFYSELHKITLYKLKDHLAFKGHLQFYILRGHYH